MANDFNFTSDDLQPTDLDFNFTSGQTGYKDLGAYAKGQLVEYKDLGAAIKSIVQATVDLPAYVTVKFPDQVDLKGRVRTFQKSISGLQSIINVIEIRDLPTSITAELFKGQANLGAEIESGLSGYANLSASIFGPSNFLDLQGIINVVSVSDLPVFIKAFIQNTKDLQTYLNTIQIGNLPASIHGFDTRNLLAIAGGVYGPDDLQASIVGTGGYKLLEAYIRSMLGVEIPRGLFATVIGSFSQDLPAVVQSITPIDLQALITATGQAVNLSATIIPKVIFMSQVLQVSLLEHKNLRAMINIACFSSDSRNLYAYIRAIDKVDLQGIIFGLYLDNSNIKNLGMYINTASYYVEDIVTPWLFANDRNRSHSRLKITFTTKPSYYTFDTLQVFYERPPWENLQAIITGVLTSVNLAATVTAVFDFNFSELPYYVSPRTREVVIEFDEKWREKWRRFVELFFDDSGNTPYHYFYVSGANKVYRVDRTRHWTIWAKGFDIVDSMIEYRNVRYKYIFNASKYSNVDEAIRDLIDRVSAYRRVNLPASIYGELPDHANLGASIQSLVLYSWVKHLNAYARGRIRDFVEGTTDLGASITGDP